MSFSVLLNCLIRQYRAICQLCISSCCLSSVQSLCFPQVHQDVDHLGKRDVGGKASGWVAQIISGIGVFGGSATPAPSRRENHFDNVVDVQGHRRGTGRSVVAATRAGVLLSGGMLEPRFSCLLPLGEACDIAKRSFCEKSRKFVERKTQRAKICHTHAP